MAKKKPKIGDVYALKQYPTNMYEILYVDKSGVLVAWKDRPEGYTGNKNHFSYDEFYKHFRRLELGSAIYGD